MNTIELNIDKYESMLKELGVLKTENERLREALHRACDNWTEDIFPKKNPEEKFNLSCFCGEKPHIYNNIGSPETERGQKEKEWCVICSCGNLGYIGYSAEEAVELWNYKYELV
ncbi:MAG TPA: hypothetical protein VMW10_01990 [Alphaproteobacteria bacterium]|nr:hypothetical protein [Alphaproteobacteria bacterium]